MSCYLLLLIIMSNRFVLFEYRRSTFRLILTCKCSFYSVHTREMRDDKIQFSNKKPQRMSRIIYGIAEKIEANLNTIHKIANASTVSKAVALYFFHYYYYYYVLQTITHTKWYFALKHNRMRSNFVK